MRISDWSSDVCSSDLPPQDIVLPEEVVQQGNAAMADDQDEQRPGDRRMETAQTGHPRNLAALGDQLDTESRPAMTAAQQERKSDGKGRSGSGRVELGGSRNIKTKKKKGK